MSFQDKIRNPDCTLCPLHEEAHHVCLMGSGSKKAKLMIVGEAPGQREDERHQAFVGPAGQKLNDMLQQVGLKREDFYITNAAKCRPPNNRQPTRAEIKVCSTAYLQEELQKVKPSYVLVLGNSSLQACLGKSGITKHRGLPVVREGVTYFPTFHPAAVLRNPRYDPEIRADFRRFARIVAGDTRNPLETTVKIVRNKRDLKALCEILDRQKVIAFDLETDITPPWKGGRIVSIAFTWKEGLSAVVPLHHVSGVWEAPDDVLRLLKPSLERADCKYVAHNGKFDCRWLASKGVYTQLTFDTMLAAHILDENRSKGLKPLSQVLLGADAYDVGEEIKDAYNMDFKKLVVYAGKDTDYTFRLYQRFRAELIERPRLAAIFHYLMMGGSNVLTQVETTGMWIDNKRLKRVKKKLEREESKLLKSLGKFVPSDVQYGPTRGRSAQPPGVVNFNAPGQVAQWIFRDLGLKPLKKTESGANWSTDESVLKQLSTEHPAIKLLLDLRGVRKNLTTYVYPWAEHQDDHGRVHTYYKLYGTVTGRLSSKEPNLQQVPREGSMRTCYGAPPGWSFVEADYSQIELRIAAWLAPEPELLRIFHAGEDPHLATGAELARKTPEQVKQSDATGRTEYRKRAKGVNFGFLYGMGEDHFIDYSRDNYGFTPTPAEAALYRRRYFEKYRGLLPWHERQRRLVQRYGRVHSPIGRVRNLPDVFSKERSVRGEAERQAINSPVQSFASDAMLVSLVLLAPQLRANQARIVGTVHDALLFEVKDEYLEEILPLIHKVMTKRMVKHMKKWFNCEITVPIDVEIKYGSHWGDKEGSKVWEP